MLVEDPWLARDKLEHFLLSAIGVIVSYILANRTSALQPYRISTAVAATLFLSTLKEIGDLLQVRACILRPRKSDA